MNKVAGKIKISYVLVEIFERPLNIPKRPSKENIGIVYNYGPGVRGTNAQCLPSPILENCSVEWVSAARKKHRLTHFKV